MMAVGTVYGGYGGILTAVVVHVPPSGARRFDVAACHMYHYATPPKWIVLYYPPLYGGVVSQNATPPGYLNRASRYAGSIIKMRLLPIYVNGNVTG